MLVDLSELCSGDKVLVILCGCSCSTSVVIAYLKKTLNLDLIPDLLGPLVQQVLAGQW